MSSKFSTAIVLLSLCQIFDQLLVPTNKYVCPVETSESFDACVFKRNVILTAVVVKGSNFAVHNSKGPSKYLFGDCLKDSATKLQSNQVIIFTPDVKDDELSDCMSKIRTYSKAFILVNLFRDQEAPAHAPIWNSLATYPERGSNVIVGVVMRTNAAPSQKPLSERLIGDLGKLSSDQLFRTTTFGVQLDAVRFSHTMDLNYEDFDNFRIIVIKQHPQSKDSHVKIPQLYKHLQKIQRSRFFLLLTNAVYEQLVNDHENNVLENRPKTTTVRTATTSARNGGAKMSHFSWLLFPLNSFELIQLRGAINHVSKEPLFFMCLFCIM